MQKTRQVSSTHEVQVLRLPPMVILGAAGLAFALYVATMAPGLTWANQGADGGELIAVALTNGVPHPPGYPLYILLLQLWLKLTTLFFAGSEPARLGNLLSAALAAASVGVTVTVAAAVVDRFGTRPPSNAPTRWVWPLLIGLTWMQSPLFWGQAIITEVYALHMLLVSILGWALLAKKGAARYLVPVVALGVAHHLTFVLLLPAALYLLWANRLADEQTSDEQTSVEQTLGRQTWSQRLGLLMQPMLLLFAGCIIGALFYIRLPLAAGTGAPINWGYPDNWAGFWWLVGAQAYRSYLFNVPADSIFNRVAAWAYTLTSQYTFVGLGLGLVGLAHWDEVAPRLRNFCLLWMTPISLYALSYYTRDSNIYLLPVIWILAICLAVGGPAFLGWVQTQWPSIGAKLSTWGIVGALLALLVMIGLRVPQMSLRQDSEARTFLNGARTVIEPDSIVISSADQETFAVWYGAWGSGELLRIEPPPVFVNYALLQFPWYRRQLAEQYPEIPGLDQSLEQVISANVGGRTIYFTEKLTIISEEQIEAIGPIWRYKP